MAWQARSPTTTLSAPVTEHAVARSCGCVISRSHDQFTATKALKSALNRAFGKPGFVRKRAETCCDGLPIAARGTAIKMQINQKSGRLLVMTNQIAHQDVEHVIVDRDSLFKAGQRVLRS